MPESTFAEFAKFIDEALDDFRLEQADSDPAPEKQMLSDWWTCFSLVVVPDLLLKAEALNPAILQSPGLAISTPDETFPVRSDVLPRSFSGNAPVSR